MKPLVIPVFYDFASTISFVAHRVMERMTADLATLGIELEWRPIDLVKITGWPRGAAVDGPRRENALRVARELGVEARMPGAWIDSRAAHAVALSFGKGPREATWRERVWTAVFEEGRDVGRLDEIERLGRDLDIDAPALASAHALATLDADTLAAREAEVSGVPTFDLGFPYGGIQEPETMRLVFERWVRKKRQPDE